MTVIKLKKFYGEVSVQAHLAERHREHCLCWQNCKFFKKNTPENCETAQALYEFDKKYNVTTPVWECGKYESDIITDKNDPEFGDGGFSMGSSLNNRINGLDDIK